jgi:hypothetical protein
MLCKIEFIKIIDDYMTQNMRLGNFWGQRPNPLLCFCLCAAREKLYVMPNGINCCVVFVVLMQFNP